MRLEYAGHGRTSSLRRGKTGPIGWLTNFFRPAAATHAETSRLRAFCTALAQQDGEALDGDPLLLDFIDVQAKAGRRGLTNGGSGWSCAVRLTEAGWRMSGKP